MTRNVCPQKINNFIENFKNTDMCLGNYFYILATYVFEWPLIKSCNIYGIHIIEN
jgi:hypothetical protein